MNRQSAGVLLYHHQPRFEVLLIHPGGPFWTNRDLKAWSLPKGEFNEGDDPKACAVRELAEETGKQISVEDLRFELGHIKQKNGKTVYAWATEGDFDPATHTSNTIPIQWPPRSNKIIMIPEADRSAWFSAEEAKQKINPAQADLIDRLLQQIAAS